MRWVALRTVAGSARLRIDRRKWRTGDDKHIVRGITWLCDLGSYFDS